MRYLLLLAFFFSGFSSLILENVWVRMLTLVFGGTTLAITTVLTVFMTGLALGSVLAGRYAHKLTRPVSAYGILEALIAIYAMLLPTLLQSLPWFYQLLPETLPFAATALYRFVLCFFLLLIPTTLMGATLPILSAFFVKNPKHIGSEAGLLYSFNIFGAVLGAFASGFVMMPLLGIPGTIWLTSSGLLMMGLLLAWKGRSLLQNQESNETLRDEFFEEEDPIEDIDLFETPDPFLDLSPKQAQQQTRIIFFSLITTGSVSMICQVLWSRSLAMVIGSSTYAFTMILGVFLTGLAGGTALGARISKRSMDLRASWARLLIATALFLGFTVFFTDRLPEVFLLLARQFNGETNILLLFSIKILISAIPILIPTFLMGTFFPLALAFFAQQPARIPKRIGDLYTLNTIGSIVGSVSAGFLIIPWLGIQQGFSLCIVLYLFCAWLLFWPTKSERIYTYGILFSFVFVGIWFVPKWNVGKMSLGTFRLSNLRSSKYKEAIKPGNVLFYREGISATVTVEGSKKYRYLKVNGKTDASNVGDRDTQIAVSALPLYLHPNPKQVALIGWGSGMSAGAALHFPIKSLETIEIEPAVVEASKFFQPWNYFPQRDKRLRLLYNDGRNFLATTSKQFDVIISEPSNPWISGVSNLFTKEYWEIAKKKLKQDGLFCQWVQLYELSFKNITSILKTIRTTFPYVYMFEVEHSSYDTIIIASKKPYKLDIVRLGKLLKKPTYKKLFEQVGIKSQFDIFPRFQLGTRELDLVLDKTKSPLNTDAHNRLEFTAPLDLVQSNEDKDANRFQKKVKKYRSNFLDYLKPDQFPKEKKAQAVFWRNLGESHLRYGTTKRAAKYLKKARKLDPLSVSPRLTLLTKLMNEDYPEPNIPKHWKETLGKRRVQTIKLLIQYVEVREAYLKEKYAKCLQLLEPIFKQKFFVRLLPDLYFYKGSCHRDQYEAPQAYQAFSRYIQMKKAKEKATKEAREKAAKEAREKAAKEAREKAAKEKAHSRPSSQPTTNPDPRKH